jgi:hypothetical protein
VRVYVWPRMIMCLRVHDCEGVRWVAHKIWPVRGLRTCLTLTYDNRNGACRILQQYNRYNALFVRERKGAFHCHNEPVVQPASSMPVTRSFTFYSSRLLHQP